MFFYVWLTTGTPWGHKFYDKAAGSGLNYCPKINLCYLSFIIKEKIVLNNVGLPGIILIGLVVFVIYLLVRPSKAKKEERENQKRIADALEEIAKNKKE